VVGCQKIVSLGAPPLGWGGLELTARNLFLALMCKYGGFAVQTSRSNFPIWEDPFAEAKCGQTLTTTSKAQYHPELHWNQSRTSWVISIQNTR